MRFESVTADAFGPFTRKTLTFSPAMTVIFGLNEAGKSSWHACLYAALCGMRRGRGQPRVEDRLFADLHRPWDGEEWRVRAMITLEDGRRIELRQELTGRVDCAAMDLAKATDVSAEIINDGAPDGSRWLGLDRRSFLATACVRQADLLGVLDDPGALQEHLQRAAATAGTDATAAAAIEHLEAFWSERVGLQRRNSTRPLQKALNDAERAEASLQRAREAHDAHQGLAAKVDAAKATFAEADLTLRLVEAARHRDDAARLQQTVDRARELHGRFPNGAPADMAADDELAGKVTAAVTTWRNRPDPVDLAGDSSEELERRLESLPPVPTGDTRVHEKVDKAKRRLATAQQALELIGAAPSQPTQPHTGRASIETLLELANDLEAQAPELDPVLVQAKERAQQDVAAASRWRTPMLIVGALAVFGGSVLLATGLPIPGIAAVLTGAGIVVVAFLTSNVGKVRALQRLRAVESALGQAQHDATAVRNRRDLALAKVSELGLPTDAAGIHALVRQLSGTAAQQTLVEQWQKRKAEADSELSAALEELRNALEARGIERTEDVDRAVRDYEKECEARAQAAFEAAQRPALERRLKERLTLEQTAAHNHETREKAERSLREAAAEASVARDSSEALCGALVTWTRQRAETLEKRQAELKDWSALTEILAGGTIEELEMKAAMARRRAIELAEGVHDAALNAVVLEPDVDAQIAALRSEAERCRSEASELSGQLVEQAKGLPDVAEAEERFDSATEELARVRDLDRILSLTLQHLREAQERVHRDIAPVLRAAVERWLPEATDGRYTEVLVNPETLEVSVRGEGGSAWRPARLLSQGTRELIYLLLRVALAQHLVRTEEVSPLVLDDVTVQCDTQRTCRLLSVLHALSADRQIILFSQEDDVLAWAKDNLQAESVKILADADPGATLTLA